MTDDSLSGHSSDEDPNHMDPADVLLQRGSWLRQLRQLEEEDEAARRRDGDKEEADGTDREIHSIELSDGSRVLQYESFLDHQRVYDDLKHIDNKYIDFRSSALIIEQDKSLGKGGFCWDAAYVLGEFLSQASVLENVLLPTNPHASTKRQLRIIELGAGTGLCGMMLAQALSANVILSDLELLMPLLRRNMARNFADGCLQDANTSDSVALHQYISSIGHAKSTKGTVTSAILDWGVLDHSFERCDMVIGADVVASLYDPYALARTIHSLSDVAVISFKERLSSVHRDFERHMADFYESIEIIRPTRCRNKNPNVQILVAKGIKS